MKRSFIKKLSLLIGCLALVGAALYIVLNLSYFAERGKKDTDPKPEKTAVSTQTTEEPEKAAVSTQTTEEPKKTVTYDFKMYEPSEPVHLKEGDELPLIAETPLVIECERFIVQIENGLYISPSLLKTLNDIVDVAEEVTGYSLNPGKLQEYYWCEKPTFEFKRRELSAGGELFIECAWCDGATFYEEGASVGVLTLEYATLMHEILHVLQLRNTSDISLVLSEGFAESYLVTAMPILKDRYGYNIRSNEECDRYYGIGFYGYGECGLMPEAGEYASGLDWLTPELLVQYFFLTPQGSGHEPSYWNVKYIRETYGDERFLALCQKGGELNHSLNPYGGNLDTEAMLNLIKEEFGEDFLDDYLTWLLAQGFGGTYNELVDVGENAVWPGYFGLVCMAGEQTPLLQYPNALRFKDSMLIDYSEAVSLIKVLYPNLIYNGLFGTIYADSDVTVQFIDEDGNIVDAFTDDAGYFKGFFLGKKVVKILFSGEGEHNVTVYGSDFDAFSKTKEDLPEEERLYKLVRQNGYIDEGSSLVITDGYGVKLDTDILLFGKLASEGYENIVFGDGMILMYEGSDWENRDFTISVKNNPYEMAEDGFFYAFGFHGDADGKVHYYGGIGLTLCVTELGDKKFADCFAADDTECAERVEIYRDGVKIN